MKTFLKKTFTLFIQGLLTLLPLLVSIWVLYILFSFVEGMADNLLVLLPEKLGTVTGVRILFKTVAVGLLFLSITFIGLLMKTVIGKVLVKWVDALFSKIPGISNIYIATKQVVEVFRSGKKQFFTNPVMVEYPSRGIWMVGFNTGEILDAGIIDEKKRHYTIFIPTTPNPTSGYLAVIAEDRIRNLDISVEDAIKMVLTGGMVKKDTAIIKRSQLYRSETSAARVANHLPAKETDD